MADLEELQEALVVDEVTKAKLAQARGEKYEAPPKESDEDEDEKQVQQIDFEARMQEIERRNQDATRQNQEMLNQQNMIFQQQLAQMQEQVSRAVTPQKKEEDEFPDTDEDLEFGEDLEDARGMQKLARFLQKGMKQNKRMFEALNGKMKEQAVTTEQRVAELQEQFKYGWQLNFEREFKKHVQGLIDSEDVFAPLGSAKRHLVTEIMQKVRFDPEFQGVDNVNDLAEKHIKSEAAKFKAETNEKKAKSGESKVKQKKSEELPPSSRGGASMPPGMGDMEPEKYAAWKKRMEKDPAFRKAQSLAFIEGSSPKRG